MTPGQDRGENGQDLPALPDDHLLDVRDDESSAREGVELEVLEFRKEGRCVQGESALQPGTLHADFPGIFESIRANVGEADMTGFHHISVSSPVISASPTLARMLSNIPAKTSRWASACMSL